MVAAATMSAAAVSLSFSMVAATVSCLPMSVSFPMVVTLYIWIVCEAAVQKCLHSRVRAAADTTVELYACFRERGLCAAADAAADQHIHAAKRPASAPCPVPFVPITRLSLTLPSSTSYTLNSSVCPKC